MSNTKTAFNPTERALIEAGKNTTQYPENEMSTQCDPESLKSIDIRLFTIGRIVATIRDFDNIDDAMSYLAGIACNGWLDMITNYYLGRTTDDFNLKMIQSFDKLRKVLGDTANATDNHVRLYQEDSTHEFVLQIGSLITPKTYYGKTLVAVIEAAYDDQFQKANNG